jgi:hypothetical protein
MRRPSEKDKRPADAKAHVIGPGEVTMTGGGGLGAVTDRYRPKKDNSDIADTDSRPGRDSSKLRVRQEAERLLLQGDPGTKKWEFGDRLSKWLARHHPGEPQMSGQVVERHIGDLWRKYVTDVRRRRRLYQK